jgi:hypothetical protein
MKKIIIIISLIFVSSFKLFPQWSTDPNNNLIVGYGLDPKICSDSAGGCYITYDYNNTSYPRWLALERLDRYGLKPWGINKRIIGEYPGQSKAQIVEDGEGGVIVSYEDRLENLPSWTANVRVQKVDSNGNFLWGPTGVKVTLDEINQGSQKIVNDGEGGAVVIWVNTLAEYKVNRISSEGQRMWGDSGIVLGINGYYDPAILVRTTGNKYVASPERNTYKYLDETGNMFYTGSVVWLENIISDGNGGIVFTSRGGQFPSNWQLRAQRKDSLGNSLWQEPHIVVAESLYFNSRPSFQYNNGYFYFGWSGMKNGIDRVAQLQALRGDGSKLFLEGSISISNNTPLSVAGIVTSDSSKTIFIWNDHPNLPDSTLVQLFDSLGNKIWNDYAITLAHPAISYQTHTSDCNGGFILGGIINEFTVVAQQVSRNGKLGQIVTHLDIVQNELISTEVVLHQNYPNPYNSSTIIKYQIPKEGWVRIVLYNVVGEELKILVDEYKTIGTYSLVFNSNELPSGVYLYSLKTGSIVIVKKLTIIK